MFTEQDFNKLMGAVSGTGTEQGNVQRYPLTDIGYDQDSNLIISVAIAGFAKEDIQIEQAGNMIHISSKHQPDTREIQWVHRNISAKDFHRIVRIQEHYITGDISASVKNGILTIKVVPEKLKEETRSIKIG